MFILSKQTNTPFLRRLSFYHVGRKHIQHVTYSIEQCKAYNLLLSETNQLPNQQHNIRKLTSKAVNRLFVSCLFSKIIGNNFPLNYRREIKFGETIIGEIQVIKDLGKRKYQIQTVCKSIDGQLLVDGIAIILQQ